MRDTLRAAWLPGAVLVVALTLVSNRYGFHRDELYFRMLPPAWGYLDQPPFAPWLARTLTGVVDQPWLLRVPATLASVSAVLLSAAITAELGGDQRARRACAWGAGFAGFPVLLGHVALTSTFDHAVTLGVVLAALLALRRDPRWWVVAGLLAGLATYNRLLVPLVVLGIVAGLALLGPRRALRSGWLWAGAAVGALVCAPNLIWQARHGWPQLDVGAALSDNNAAETRMLLPLVLVVAVGPFLLPTVVRGVRRAWAETTTRWVVVTAVVMVGFTALSGAQPHYPVTLLVVLFAVGCAVPDRAPGRAALGANALTSAVIGLPVLPVAVLDATPVPAMNPVAADQVGWPTYTDQVARAWTRVDPGEAAVFTSNYGEAGAVARYGPALGLPEPYSGHNELGLAAPPGEEVTTLLVVGWSLERIEPMFDECSVVDRLDNGVGVDNEEQGAPLAVCTGRQEPWAQVWPQLRHLD